MSGSRTRRLRTVINDPVIAREIFWCIVTGAVVWLAFRLQIGFAYDRLYLLFAPKVPFLGLIITAATFQYRTWRELSDRDSKAITDSTWMQFERNIATVRADIGDEPEPRLPEWERSLKEWKTRNVQVTGRVPVLVEKRNGAFFRLVQLTTNAPPGRAATGGTRHGQEYQGTRRSA